MIKDIDKSEIDEVMDIWLKTNITAHSFLSEAYWVKNYDLVKEEYIPASTTFIYQEDHMVKGFISVMGQSFIGALFVLEDYQGQGIGKKLLNHCKGLYEHLELAVYTENKPSVNFYKHCGFTVEKEQQNEDSGHREYIMNWEK